MDWSLIQKIATMNGWFYPSWYSWNANQIHQSLRRLLQPKRTTWVAPILPWDLKRFSLTPKKTLRPHTLSCPSKPGVNMLNIIESDDGKIHTGKPLINKCDGFQKKKHGFRCRGHPSGWTMRTSQGIPGGPVGGWGHPASRNCHRGSPGSFHSWRSAQGARAGCAVLGRWSTQPLFGTSAVDVLRLLFGKIWKHHETPEMSAFHPSGRVWFQSAEHWTLNQTFITIYHLPAYYAAAHKTQSK